MNKDIIHFTINIMEDFSDKKLYRNALYITVYMYLQVTSAHTLRNNLCIDRASEEPVTHYKIRFSSLQQTTDSIVLFCYRACTFLNKTE